MSVEAREQARDLVSSLRELVVDLRDEGVDTLEVAAAEPQPPPSPRPASKPTRTEPSPPAAARAELPPAGDVATWGPSPSLDEVREQLGECNRCGLCEGRNTIVFGSGNPNADLMFIGEGPGEQEDRQGLPFVGRAGELLTQMIEKGIEIPRKDVYICNIVKCRPPRNRNPRPVEIAACRPFLDGQIAAVKPRVIVSLGKPAASLLLDREVAITHVRGTWQDYRGTPLMPTLHPAFILREYTPENRRYVWEDLKAAVARSREQAG